MRTVRALLLTALLGAADFLMYRYSPSPGAISGNGFHPLQYLGFVCLWVLAIPWLLAWGRVGLDQAARLGTRVALGRRRGLAISGLLTAVGLYFWAWQTFFAWETTTAYYQRSGASHGWGLLNQYTLGFWATSWPTWLGFLIGAVSAGLAVAPRSSART